MWDAETQTLSGTSHVVAGDHYEMRIAMPTDSKLGAKRAMLGDVELQVSALEAGGVRIGATPVESAMVSWKVEFE
jgi:hypothetical protein